MESPAWAFPDNLWQMTAVEAGNDCGGLGPPKVASTALGTVAPPSRRIHAAVALLGIAASALALDFAARAPSSTAKLNDFYREAWPAYAQLRHGDLAGFLHAGPAYFGSLVLRAPFALLPGLWGGGATATYAASAVPCLLVAVAFCVWLAAQPRRRGGIGWASRSMPIVLCIFNPLVLVALFGGHPEEILGAVLCVGAVLCASSDRPGWAGLLLGLAVLNKSWALVAVPVVIAVSPAGRRRALLVLSGVGGAGVLAFVLAHGNGLSGTTLGTDIGWVFNPPQLLWWFGRHSWIAREARPGFVLLAVACAIVWARRTDGRKGTGSPDALLLLALVLLLRAALDPWNNVYYHVPFLFALLAYETRAGRMPLLTIAASAALLVVVPVSGVPHMSPDVRAAAYAATVLPAIAFLVAHLYSSPRGRFRLPPSRWTQRAGRRHRGAQAPTLV